MRRRLIGLLLAVVCAVLVTSVVFVDETEYVVVQRLGRIVAVYDQPESRGLRVKLPWPIDSVLRFDRRMQLFDPVGREMFTRDKKNITVETYICWKIAEPEDTSDAALLDRPVVRFFRSLGTSGSAEDNLERRVRSILGTEIGKVELSGLLNATDSERGPDPAQPGPLDRLSEILRAQLTQRDREKGSLRDNWGIEIVDVRLRRINLPSGNQPAVFERMKTERKKIADRYRNAGMAENRIIRSQADRQYSEILARARAEAERIRGKAEADSIAILNQAHAQDPEFYRVQRTLDSYKRFLNEKTTLVLSASSSLFKLLSEGVPEVDKPAAPPAEKSPVPTTGNATGDKVSGLPGAKP